VRSVAVALGVAAALGSTVGPVGPAAARGTASASSPESPASSVSSLSSGTADPTLGDPGASDATPRVTPSRDRAVVVLDTLTPGVVRAGTDVRITGSVTAPLTGPLTGPTVRVVRGDVTVNQRTALDDWASGRTPADGPTVATRTLPDVASGTTRTFSITLPSAKLYDRAAFAALPIAVEVVQDGASEAAGSARTFLAWNNRKEYVPLRLATVLPLTLDPDTLLFSRDDEVRRAAWQRAIGPGSRVDRIVSGTTGRPVTLAVDPSVFGPDASPADAPSGTPTGTSTGTPTGTQSGTTPTPPATGGTGSTSPTPQPTTQPTDGAGQPAAPSAATRDIARLGDALAADLARRSLWALPYADADVAAAVGIDPTNAVIRDLVSRSSAVAARVHQPVRGDVVWPVDGLLPPGRESGIRTLLAGTTVKKAAGIVVNRNAVTATSPYTPSAARVATGGTRLLTYDPRLSALLPKRTDSSPVLSTQRFLAESLVLLGERPGSARSVLVTAPRTYDPDPDGLSAFLSAVADAPWLDGVDSGALLADTASDKATPQQKPAGVVAPAAPPPVLDARRLAYMAHQRETLLSVAAVLADGAEFERVYREVLDELASTRWRYNPKGWGVLSASVTADVRAATQALKVVQPRSTVNLLAENGTLRITIENGLDYEVADLRLRLAPTNPRVQVVSDPGPITIGPSSRTNVQVEVAAVAAGKAEIRAWLTTADGTVIGTPAQIAVSANPIDGAIYWVGGILVGLVLLAGIARAVLKGTSRVDEIPDIEAVTAAHEAVEDGDHD
jgi:hypothetical protein